MKTRKIIKPLEGPKDLTIQCAKCECPRIFHGYDATGTVRCAVLGCRCEGPIFNAAAGKT